MAETHHCSFGYGGNKLHCRNRLAIAFQNCHAKLSGRRRRRALRFAGLGISQALKTEKGEIIHIRGDWG